MQTIHKIVLPLDIKSVTEMPLNHKILKAGEQNGEIVIWFECDDKCKYAPEIFEVVPTGGKVPKDYDYIDTVQMFNGLVWHIYKQR